MDDTAKGGLTLKLEQAILRFLAQKIKDSKVRAAKDHGKKF